MASEKRLIDADDCGRYIASRMGFSQASLENVMQYMEAYTKQNEVDAVEVVRCKDCRGALPGNASNTVYCQGWERTVSKDGFCSYGERKDNERKAD